MTSVTPTDRRRCANNVDMNERRLTFRHPLDERSRRSVERYLPNNYVLLPDGRTRAGVDVAGWTAEYVRDRLASGMWHVTLDEEV